MFNYLLSKLKSTNGFAFPLVLLSTVLVVSLLVAGLAPMITTQARHIIHSEEQLIAKYAAETGVKRGLRLANDKLSTPKNNVKPKPNEIQPKKVDNESLFDSGGVRYSYEYKYIPGEINKPSNPERIEVTAKASVNKVTAESMAWIVFETDNIPGYVSPTLAHLVESANYNHDKNCYHWESKDNNTSPWNLQFIDGKKYACPANGTDENIILFDNDFNSAEFNLDYKVSFEKKSSSGSGGVGIIYGASDSDTAKNFNAYCVKFNNDRKSFSVTKFIADNNAYNTKGLPKGRPVELCIEYKKAGKRDASDLTDENSYLTMFQPNGTGVNRVDAYNNKIGRCSIPYSELEKAGFNPYGNDGLSIKIETKKVSANVYNKDGLYKANDLRLRHTVSLSNDGINYEKVLEFIDFSDVSPVKTYALANTSYEVTKDKSKIDLIDRKKDPNNLKQIRTGLRVWNVQRCGFFSNTKKDDDQVVYNIKQIIWKK